MRGRGENAFPIRKRMKDHLRAWALLAATLSFCVLFLSACGKKSDLPKENSAVFDKDGGITVTTFEDFPEARYDKSELKKAVDEEIKDYNERSSKKAVKLQDLKISDGKATAVIEYDSWQDFHDFNGGAMLYYGTVDGIRGLGWDLSRLLMQPSLKNSSRIMNTATLDTLGSSRLIYVSEPLLLVFEGDPLFMTSGCRIEEGGRVRVPDTTSESQPAIILYEK